jgi:hypothetical protein
MGFYLNKDKEQKINEKLARMESFNKISSSLFRDKFLLVVCL